MSVTKYILSLQGMNIEPISRRPFGKLSDERKKEIERLYYENAD